jgi:hypothetical protein
MGKMAHSSSIVFRVTAWYDWLLIVLALALGVYTCKCLDYSLSIGVQNALSIQAREIGNMFAATGQIPDRQSSSGQRLNDPFVSLRQSSGSVDGLSGKPESQMVVVAPEDVRRDLNSLAWPGGRPTMRKSRFLMAAANSTFGNKKYVVEVGTSKQPIKAVFRETTKTMLIGLLVGLALATLGSAFFVKSALVPVRKIALAVQELPVIHSEEEGIKAGAVLQQIENLCVTFNEMLGQLEDSFQIGTKLLAGAIHVQDGQQGKLRGELADLFARQRLTIDVTQTLLGLLTETERVSDISRNLATFSREDAEGSRTARLRFYFTRLVANRADHLCVLTKQLGGDLVLQARDRQDKHYSAQW